MPTHTIHGERGGSPQKNVSYDMCVCGVIITKLELKPRTNVMTITYKIRLFLCFFFLVQMLGHHGNAFAARIPILW